MICPKSGALGALGGLLLYKSGNLPQKAPRARPTDGSVILRKYRSYDRP